MPLYAISSGDLDALRAIAEARPVKPNHIIRLELMGLVRDTASGVLLTDEGRLAFKQAPIIAVQTGESASSSPALDALGRRKGGKFGRTSRLFE